MKKSTPPGFTIIEVMIVLILAAAILLVVFLAVPDVQRSARNRRRQRDAAVLVSAVNECLLNNNYNEATCANPTNLPLSARELSIYSGFHYGAASYHSSVENWPTMEEPNYLFGVRCINNNTWQAQSYGPRTFVVSYFMEDPSAVATLGIIGRCIDGGY